MLIIAEDVVAILPCLILPVIMALGIGLFIFWLWMLIDCATKEPSQGNDKVIWILVIVLTGWIGALIYYFARRPARIQEQGQ